MAGAFFDSADWFSSPDAQGAIIDQEFDSAIGQTPDYQGADPATQADMKLAYKQLVEEGAAQSKYNPATIEGTANQRAANNAGAIENAATAAGRSTASSAYRAINMADDLAGKVDKNYAKHLSLYAEKQRNLPMTKASKELGLDMAQWRKEYDAGGIVDKAIASAKLAGKIITNPEAIIQTGAESTGSLAASATGAFVGAEAGAAIGSVVPVAGTATGAAVGAPVGMFLGSAQDAATSKMGDRIIEALTKQGIAPTESNIQMFMDKNPGLVEKSQQDAVKYGTILGVIDTAMGGLFSRFATLPTRAARKEAMRSIDDAGRAMLAEKAKELGVSATDLTEDFINAGAKDILASQSFKSKLGYKSASYGGEVIGEPISEAAATAGVGETNTAENLIMETVGGIGAGPVGASINTTAMGTKLAGNKTGEFIKKIINNTPESKSMEAQQRQKMEEAQAQYDLDIKGKNIQDVAKTDPRDAKVDIWADPKHKDYDPVKAVKVIAKAEDLDTALIDKARGIQNDFRAQILGLGQELGGLIEKRQELDAAGQDTSNITAQIDRAEKILNIKKLTFKDVTAQVTLIKNRDQALTQAKEISPIDPETATPAEISTHITDSLGSSGNKFAATDAHIDKLLTRTDLPATQVAVLNNMKEANAARQTVVENAKVKNADQVANDIYHGMENSNFKGIDAYQRGVASHAAAGRIAEAQKQLDGLIKFRDAHQEKLTKISELYAVVKEKGVAGFTSEQAQTYKAMQRENPKFYLHPITSQNMEASISREVTALNAEVKLAESVLAGSKFQTKATPSSEGSSASTINPPQPTVEIPAVTNPVIKETADAVSPLPGTRSKREPLPPVRKDVENATQTEKVSSETPIQPTSEVTQKAQQEDDSIVINEEINESTLEEITDSFTGNLEELPVNYVDATGTEIINKPYHQAITELDIEIQEAEEILKCFKTK